MTNKNKVRIILMQFVEWLWFDRFITFLILASTTALAARDYSDNTSDYNRVLDQFSIVLAAIFGIECLLKIAAHGFVMGENTYLRSGWNVMDFLIVLSSMAGSDFKLIRLIRVLRPLRAIKRIPTLRMHTAALMESIKGVTNVAVFVGFMVYLYGVIGVQLFSGRIYYTCHTTPEPLPGATFWEVAPNTGI
jgi:hypothetical protein